MNYGNYKNYRISIVFASTCAHTNKTKKSQGSQVNEEWNRKKYSPKRIKDNCLLSHLVARSPCGKYNMGYSGVMLFDCSVCPEKIKH